MQETLIGGNCLGVAILRAQQESRGASTRVIVRVDCRRTGDQSGRAFESVSRRLPKFNLSRISSVASLVIARMEVGSSRRA